MFKYISGFEGLYAIDEFGNIVSFKYGKQRLIRSVKDKFGYYKVVLCIENKTNTYRVHRLVALTFIPNPDNYPIVMHLDNDPANNHFSNLKWGTQKDNIQQCSIDGRLNLRKKRLGRKVNQYTIHGEIIREWSCISDVFMELRINISNISSCCKGRNKTAGGFIWKYINC